MEDAEPGTALRTASRIRLNVGCGDFPLGRGFEQQDGWFNIDNTADSQADLVLSMPPIPCDDNTVEEIWSCHFLEHLDQEEGIEFVRESYRVLKPAGLFGVVVPDMRELMKRYLAGSPEAGYMPDGRAYPVADLDALCAYFIYSTVQPSHHKWMYEAYTLQRLLERVGFRVIREIDRYHDPRLGTGAWYQCGWQAQKPA